MCQIKTLYGFQDILKNKKVPGFYMVSLNPSKIWHQSLSQEDIIECVKLKFFMVLEIFSKIKKYLIYTYIEILFFLISQELQRISKIAGTF